MASLSVTNALWAASLHLLAVTGIATAAYIALRASLRFFFEIPPDLRRAYQHDPFGTRLRAVCRRVYWVSKCFTFVSFMTGLVFAGLIILAHSLADGERTGLVYDVVASVLRWHGAFEMSVFRSQTILYLVPPEFGY